MKIKYTGIIPRHRRSGCTNVQSNKSAARSPSISPYSRAPRNGRTHRESSTPGHLHSRARTAALSMQRNIHVRPPGIAFAISSTNPSHERSRSTVTESAPVCVALIHSTRSLHTYTHASTAETRAHTRARGSIFGIDVGGHYHIARSPIVEIRRRICIGFTFGQESRSPHFVLRRRIAPGPDCYSPFRKGRNRG